MIILLKMYVCFGVFTLIYARIYLCMKENYIRRFVFIYKVLCVRDEKKIVLFARFMNAKHSEGY